MLATKRIPVTPDTWHALGRLKGAGQSYDQLLREMIVLYNRANLANRAAQARRGEGEWRPLDEI